MQNIEQGGSKTKKYKFLSQLLKMLNIFNFLLADLVTSNLVASYV